MPQHLPSLVEADPLLAIETVTAFISTNKLSGDRRIELYLLLCGVLMNHSKMPGFVHDVGRHLLDSARNEAARFSALTVLRRVTKLEPARGDWRVFDLEWRDAASDVGDRSIVAITDAIESGEVLPTDVEGIRRVARAVRERKRTRAKPK
jgi:hypothetical protein